MRWRTLTGASGFPLTRNSCGASSWPNIKHFVLLPHTFAKEMRQRPDTSPIRGSKGSRPPVTKTKNATPLVNAAARNATR